MSVTVQELIEEGAQAFEHAGLSFGHGTTNALDEAAWLVLWSLGLPLDDAGTAAHIPVCADDQRRVRALLQKRVQSRQPAAYLTHEAWLQGVSFYVDERAIVPRSLIAELIAHPHWCHALDAWLSADTRRVLDLCTGNGSLAVLAAMAWPEVQVDASDISADALAVARINVERYHLQNRVRLIESDGLPNTPDVYDLILCNPPYVNAAGMAALPPEYRAEPELALAGGRDGMDFVRKLLQQASAHMSECGVLVLEIGNERDNFEAAFPALEACWLSVSAGDDQVLLLTHQALQAHRQAPNARA